MRFFNLEWKQFLRSASFGKGMAIKILMFFFALYFLIVFLSLGIGGYFFLKKEYPEQDPFVLVNQFLIFGLISDLIFRYIMQKIPIMDIKPMLILPVRKNKLVNYVLTKSIFSFFNLGTLMLYIPFAIVLLSEGYNTTGILGWMFFIITTTLSLNFTNFLINKNKKALFAMVLLLGVLWVSYTYQLFDLTSFFGSLFYKIYEIPALAFLGVLVFGILYYLNFKELSSKLYLDSAIKAKVEEAKTSNLSFIDRLGSVAPFIKNDIRLIARNKRTKSVFLMSFLFLLFGLFFFNSSVYKDSEVMLLYACIFMTGGFSINYGQFVPAWDGEHYNMLMSQNFNYRKYLESKWYLMVMMTVILFVLSTPYLYFGFNKYLLIVTGFLFNLGFTPLMMLFIGAYNRKKIDLTKGGYTNTQGTSATQFLALIPVMLLPMLVYAVVNHFMGFNVAIAAIALIGIISFVFKNSIMNGIERKYQEKKYITIHGFKQKV